MEGECTSPGEAVQEGQRPRRPRHQGEHGDAGESGRVPAGCGYCFGTSPNPSERGQSAGNHHSKLVFKTPSTPRGLHLRVVFQKWRWTAVQWVSTMWLLWGFVANFHLS